MIFDLKQFTSYRTSNSEHLHLSEANQKPVSTVYNTLLNFTLNFNLLPTICTSSLNTTRIHIRFIFLILWPVWGVTVESDDVHKKKIFSSK